MANLAAKQLKGSATGEELLARITAEPDLETGLLDIAAVAPNPGRAEATAHAFSRALLNYARGERNRRATSSRSKACRTSFVFSNRAR